MRTFLRQTKILGFSVLETLAGILILTLVATMVVMGYSDISRLEIRQERLIQEHLHHVDAFQFEAWL